MSLVIKFLVTGNPPHLLYGITESLNGTRSVTFFLKQLCQATLDFDVSCNLPTVVAATFKNIAEASKTWMGKLLVTSDRKSCCCCWKSAIRRINVVRIHQSSYLEANLFVCDGARGRRQYGHFIPSTKLFRYLAGWKNESSKQISGYRQSVTFAGWNYGIPKWYKICHFFLKQLCQATLDFDVSCNNLLW